MIDKDLFDTGVARIFLVGGGVRDPLLGRPSNDRDFVVLGADEDTLLKRFPGAKAVGPKEDRVYLADDAQYTLSSARTIEEDLAGRDLTINAMARENDQNGTLIAHPLALQDLRDRWLRPISDRNFLDDPNRVFRAARFAAQLPDFVAHEDLPRVMRWCAGAGALERVKAERVGAECRKALTAPRPGRFLTLLAEAGAMTPWFEELKGAEDTPAGPPAYHSGSVLEHIIRVMDVAALNGGNEEEREVLVWMALCHDLGKLATDPAQWPHHHGHDVAGQERAEALGERLRLPKRLVRAGRMAARWHMTAARYATLRPATRVDMLTELHGSGGEASLTRPLFALTAADRAGRGGEAAADLEAQARRDLETMLSVRLEPHESNLGPRSGELLRERRCQALSADRNSSRLDGRK